jgi:hypothetical protein
MSRLTIDLTEQQHQNLRALALLQGKTIKQYVLDLILPADTDQTLQKFKTMLAKSTNDGLKNKLSSKTSTENLNKEISVDNAQT